jgi:dynein heavy chain
LNAVQKEYLRFRGADSPPLPPSFPRMAGTALWTRGLVNRINRQMELIQSVAIMFKKSSFDEAKVEHQKLVSTLEDYMKKVHLEWCAPFQTVEMADPEHLASRLTSFLLIRSSYAEHRAKEAEARAAALAQGGAAAAAAAAPPAPPTKEELQKQLSFLAGKLEMNFDESIMRLLVEVKYWEKFRGEYNIPYVAKDMSERAEPLRVLRENVMLVVRDYNQILDALSPEERRLFAEHLRRVDRKVAPGLNKLTWVSKSIKEGFVKTCRDQCRDTYDLVLKFHENHRRILALCRKIAFTPLVEIPKNQVG